MYPKKSRTTDFDYLYLVPGRIIQPSAGFTSVLHQDHSLSAALPITKSLMNWVNDVAKKGNHIDFQVVEDKMELSVPDLGAKTPNLKLKLQTGTTYEAIQFPGTERPVTIYFEIFNEDFKALQTAMKLTSNDPTKEDLQRICFRDGGGTNQRDACLCHCEPLAFSEGGT
ncbi:MAG: hypothetical protein AAFO96_03945, partial [Bacteroidota bacterium]